MNLVGPLQLRIFYHSMIQDKFLTLWCSNFKIQVLSLGPCLAREMEFGNNTFSLKINEINC